MSDPIHEENGKWYFWNEVWADRYGPYDSKQKAIEQLKKYCKEVLVDDYYDENH